jgi:hypothetical protein
VVGEDAEETLIAPVGPAASSSALATVSPTSRVSSSDSGDWARQRRTKSRMSGMEDGRAGKVCDRTTTGTTSIVSLTNCAGLSIAALRFADNAKPPVRAVTGTTREYVETGSQYEPERPDICVLSGDCSVLRYDLDGNSLF